MENDQTFPYKGCLENSDIMLNNHDDMITDDKTLAKTFNEHYISTVERSSGLRPEKMKFEYSLNTTRNILHSITDRYKNRLPIKLVKLASEVLSKPLSTAMNNSITSSTFPDWAKVATVVPIDKKTDDKYV